MKPSIKNYRITLEWSEEDEAFIARVPAFRHCLSHGDSPEEAIRMVQEALEGVVETMEAHGHDIPQPDMTRQRLSSVERFLNLSALARESGLNKHTLRAKLRNGTRFTPEEAAAIERVLP